MRKEPDSHGTGSALDTVLADYMRRVDRGEKIDQAAFIAAHPELADELRAYFSHSAAVGGAGTTATANFADNATPRSGLEVRCPNCHAPMEVAADTALTDLTCSACGSHFSLVDQSQATRMAPSLSKMGRFELIERLGVGGFGSVWKARDKELDRTVAIKIPRAGDMTAEDQEKFFREARAAAQLKHPSIVSVHEVGRDGDSVYIVSDFVRGVTLGDWLTGQKLTSREAAELCANIADALHHAHEQGVVHRDLKPANIMIDGDGEPHLMDFGLARREVGEVTVTLDGHVLGTPAYMSPEQAQGESHQADRRSDVYSLGVILFQLLTGELPFRGNAQMLMHQVINDEPPSPRKLNAIVPKDLETITLKCLEKEPVRRYQTSKVLSDELRRFLSGEPIHARPVSRPERSIRWIRRNRIVSALLASVALALLSGTIVSTYFAIDARRQSNVALAKANEAIAAKQQADAARHLAEQAKAESERHLYAQLIVRAGQELESNNVREARRLLAIAPVSLRGWEFSFLHHCLDRSIATYTALASSDGAVSAAAVSQDSKILLLGLYSGRICLIDTANGDRIASHMLEGQIEALAIDPSNRLLAASHSIYSEPAKFSISIVNLANGQLAAQMKGQLEQVNSLAFSSDGKWLASGAGGARGEHAVKIWNTTTWEVKHVLRGHGSPVKSVVFNKQNTQLLSGASERVVLWDISSGDKVRQFTTGGSNAATATFSADDSQVVVGSDDATIRTWKTDGTGDAKLLRGHADGVSSISAIGGDRLLSTSRDRTIRIWNLQNGTQMQLLRGHDSEPLVAFATSQPMSIISVDDSGTVKRWGIATPLDVEAIAGTEAGVTVMAPDPNSKWLVTGSNDETVRVWDLVTGKELASLVGHKREGFRADITGLAVVGPGPSIISSSRDLTVRIWNARTFKEVHVLRGHKRDIEWIAAATDGSLGASTGSYDKQLILWDLRNGRESARIEADSWWAGAVAFSKNKEFLACGGSHGTILVRDTATLKEVHTLGRLKNWVHSLAYSPDGTLLAAADGGLAVWSVPTSQKIWEGNFGAFVSKVAFSPDGSRLLSVDKDSVRLWDPYTGSQVWVRFIPGAIISDACFTPDGRRLVVGCHGTPSMLVFDAGSDWENRLTGKGPQSTDDVELKRDKTTNGIETALPKTTSTLPTPEKPLQLGTDASLEVKVLTAAGTPAVGADCRLVVGGYSQDTRGFPTPPSQARDLARKTNEHGIVVFRHPELTMLTRHILYVSKLGFAGETRFFDCSTLKTELSITLHAPAAVTLRYVYQPESSLMLSGERIVSGRLRLYPMESGSYRPPARAFFDLANNRRVGGGGALDAKTPGIVLDQIGGDVYFGGSRGRFDHATDMGKVDFDEIERVDVGALVKKRQDTKMRLDHVYIYESNIYPPNERTDFTGHEVRYGKFLVESIATESVSSQTKLSPSKPIAGRPLDVQFHPGSTDLDGAREVSLYWAAYSDESNLLLPPATAIDPQRFPTRSRGTKGGDFSKGGLPRVIVPMVQTDESSWSATIDLPVGCRSLALLMVDELGRTNAAGVATHEVFEVATPD